MFELKKEINSLEELFNEWEFQHKEETEEDYADYKDSEIEKNNFLPDGIINYECFKVQKNAGKSVLFIAKEANWFGDREEKSSEDSTESDGGFWMKGVAEGTNNGSMFSKRIAMMLNAYDSETYDEVNKKQECLIECAFMNLNKRGGYSASNWTTLEGYVKAYSKYIEKEIELINPDLIICCGGGVEWLIEEYITIDKNIKMVAVYHPSYFALSDKDYLEQFRCVLNGEVWSYKRGKQQDEKVDIPVKGIIFDTNKSYSETATFDMISSKKISAYDGAGDFINRFNIGDYVFYYVKGVGVVAAGIISSDTCECTYYDSVEKFRTVEMITPLSIPKSENELKSVFPAKIKEIFNHGFFWASTIKKPYLNEDECKEFVERIKEIYGEK